MTMLKDKDDVNLFYRECKVAKGAVAEVKPSRGGVKSAIE